MKLWHASAWSGDHEPHWLVVAEDKDSALEKFKFQLAQDGVWFISPHVSEITQVENYKVVFKDDDVISLEL